MIAEHLSRQADLIPLKIFSTPINIVGAGAVGSWLCLTLAKMGFGDITVFDFDTVDIENMNCQFFRFSDIGKQKTEALFDLVKDFTKICIKTQGEYKGGELGGIVISAVDSMSIRRLIYENNKSGLTRWLIDPRMGGEYAAMYVLPPSIKKEQDKYEKTLHSDDESIQERCTAKATMYTVNLLGGLIAKAIKDILTNQKYTRTVVWDIKENAMMNWCSEV